jgi:hypothetical protein
MKNLKTVTLILLVSSFSSCQLFGPKPESEEFYCKIGGEKFRPDNGGDVFFEALLLQLDQTNNRFNITALNSEDGDKKMDVLLSVPTKNKVLKVGRYAITQEGSGFCSKGYISINGSNKNHDYKAYPSSGYIEFTKVDTLKRRVSGTFAFKAKSIYTNDEIAVTDGQFNDVFYY